MIERHRAADDWTTTDFLFHQMIANPIANRKCIIEESVMRECSALWEARCARRELDVDWLVEIALPFHLQHFFAQLTTRQCCHLWKTYSASRRKQEYSDNIVTAYHMDKI